MNDHKIFFKPMVIDLSIHIQLIYWSKLRRNLIDIFRKFIYIYVYSYTYTYTHIYVGIGIVIGIDIDIGIGIHIHIPIVSPGIGPGYIVFPSHKNNV